MAYSIKEMSDGTKYVDVDVDQLLFDGLTPNEQLEMAKKVIKERFQGRKIGTEHQAFVDSDSAKEYAHPANKRIKNGEKEAKARVSTELDNLFDVGQNFRNAPEGLDGHKHPKAVGGFAYFDAIFKVCNRYYEGVVNIENRSKGPRFKDLTKIKDITESMHGSSGTVPPTMSVSNVTNNIPSSGTGVNTNKAFSLSSFE